LRFPPSTTFSTVAKMGLQEPLQTQNWAIASAASPNPDNLLGLMAYWPVLPLFAPELLGSVLLLLESVPLLELLLDPVPPELLVPLFAPDDVLESVPLLVLLPDPAPPEVLLLVFVVELAGAFWLPEP